MSSFRNIASFLSEAAAETGGNVLNKVGLVSKGKIGDLGVRLDGQTIVITGGNAGIGKEIARELFKRGARIILGCRDAALAKEAVDEITLGAVPGSSPIVIHKLDLASIESVNYFAQTLLETEPRIDVLVCNAGVMATTRRTTVDGFESNFGVNHLGHFLLILRLVDRMKQSPLAKIIAIGSAAHNYVSTIPFDNLDFSKGKWSYMEPYGASKLANILTVTELARRLPANVHTYAVDPGFANTNLFRENPAVASTPVISQVYKFSKSAFTSVACRSAAQGAACVIYCITSASNETGLYYMDNKVKKPSKAGQDAQLAAKLWEVSCEMVGMPLYKNKTTL
ncbi:Retinol dehydrogenase 12 [Halotydeus destructor]|nr:Retinol dehydrogenase 12 [Halotydeus destructor]